jgi:hypothetical protein
MVPTGHRPISLLSAMPKVFKRILLEKITQTIDNQIKNEQFGFRPEYSTTLQLA